MLTDIKPTHRFGVAHFHPFQLHFTSVFQRCVNSVFLLLLKLAVLVTSDKLIDAIASGG